MPYFEFEFLNSRYGLDGEWASVYQILWKSFKQLQNVTYCTFSIFNEGSCLPSWIFKNSNF